MAAKQYPFDHEVVEAFDQHKVVATCMVFDLIQVMWIGTWIQHHTTTDICGGLDFGKSAEILGVCQTESMSMPSCGG